MIVDENELILEEIKHSLYPGLALEIGEAARMVHELGGLFIPAHVDRPMNGLFTQLGVWPDGLNVDGVELSRQTDQEKIVKDHPELSGYSLIRNSDAHFLKDIGRCFSSFLMERRDFKELGLALKCEKGRRVEV